LAGEDIIVRLGNPTPWAITLFATTLTFPLAAMIGLVSALKTPAGEVRRGIRLLALTSAVVFVIAAAYLVWWGAIGWRSWA
jgi:hypothetical protein